MCSRRAARPRPREIVVVNHHLLLADLALKDEGFGDLLPGADAVILDEAHQVPDIAAQFFGQTWSLRQVQILLRDAVRRDERRRRARAGRCAAPSPTCETLLEELRAGLRRRRAGATTGRACRMRSWMPCRDSRRPSAALAAQLEGLGAGAGTANCARRAASLAAVARVP